MLVAIQIKMHYINFNKIEICLKPECDQHSFRKRKVRFVTDHYRFLEAINERIKNSRKSKFIKDIINGVVMTYEDIALQNILYIFPLMLVINLNMYLHYLDH